MRNVIQFPNRRQHPRGCAGCGTPMRSAPAWKRWCAKCFAGIRLGRALRNYLEVRP